MSRDLGKIDYRKLSAQALAQHAALAHDAVERNTFLRQLLLRRNARLYLGKLLEDARAEVKQALLELMDPKTVRHMAGDLVRVLEDQDGRVRKAAARCLGASRIHDALQPLVRLTRDHDPDSCKAALDALALLGDKSAVDAVIACLKHPEESVRTSAVNALLYLNDRASSENALRETLKDKAAIVRLRALYAIVGLRAKSCASNVAPLVNDPHPAVREKAVQALGVLGDLNTVPDLVQVVRTAQDVNLRLIATEALGHFKDKTSATQLIHSLKDAHVDIRCTAANALVRRNHRKAATAISDAAARESDPTGKQYLQRCHDNLLKNDRRPEKRKAHRHQLLLRDWYSNPSMDAGSLIYIFRKDGTGHTEDFAMGITRGGVPFRYELVNASIFFEFSDRPEKVETTFKIRRAKYRDPHRGMVDCLLLEFAKEPYFPRHDRGRTIYYSIL